MEAEILSQIGVGGLVAIIIVRDLIKAFLEKKNPSKSEELRILLEVLKLCQGTNSNMKELHHWHQHEDANGVKSWYHPKEQKEKINNIEKMTIKILDKKGCKND